MSDVDFCCVIKPVRKAEVVECKAKPVACKKCTGLRTRYRKAIKREKELVDMLIRLRNSVGDGTHPKFKELRDENIELMERWKRQENKIISHRESILKQNHLLGAIAKECDLFLKHLDGIQPPFHNTPEEVTREIRQRCVNHMLSMKSMATNGEVYMLSMKNMAINGEVS